MLEVVKIFIEQAFKLLDLKQILAHSKGKKKAEIGETLFSLYSDLNEIYVTGSIMVEEIEFVVRKRQQYIQENRISDLIPDIKLGRILKAQQSSLYRFAVSLQKAIKFIDIIDPETTRRLTLFLSTKMNILNLLNGVFVGQRKDLLLSSDAETNILAVVENFFENRTYNNVHDSLIQNQLEQAVNLASPELNLAQITVAQAAQFERYVELRRPKEHLKELKVILDNFRGELVKHFDTDDILLRVGNRHNSDGDPKGVWWNYH